MPRGLSPEIGGFAVRSRSVTVGDVTCSLTVVRNARAAVPSSDVTCTSRAHIDGRGCKANGGWMGVPSSLGSSARWGLLAHESESYSRRGSCC